MEFKPFDSEFENFLRDESRRSGRADAIAFARTPDEVRDALETARNRGWKVTLQGARTGIAAGAVPSGGLILNLSRMNRIGEIKGDSVAVQPGALLSDIRTAVADKGLFFPPDPTETSASIGGMLASNASGALSYHYGPTRNWIKALRVVLPDGDMIRVERGMRADGLHFELKTESGRIISGELPDLKMPAVKSAAGYFVRPDMDLIDLFIGMEGTLGVIAEAELKLIPEPPAVIGMTAFLPSEKAALKFVQTMRMQERRPVAIEYFNSDALNLLRNARTKYSAFGDIPELLSGFCSAVYLEFHGDSTDELEEQAMSASEIMTGLGAGEDDCWFASALHELEPLRRFRHATPEAVNLLIDERRKSCPELTKLGTDMSVPDHALEEVMELYNEGLKAARLESVIFGHIGDNHVHVNIIPRDMQDYEKGKKLYLFWADQIVAMGGSVSAEHGIGKIKTALLEKMYGADGIAAMRRLRKIFDPEEMLNPGNLFNSENMK